MNHRKPKHAVAPPLIDCQSMRKVNAYHPLVEDMIERIDVPEPLREQLKKQLEKAELKLVDAMIDLLHKYKHIDEILHAQAPIPSELHLLLADRGIETSN